MRRVHMALELDSTNLLANAALTRVQYYSGDPAFAATAEKALALDPRNPEMLGLLGILLAAYGDAVHGTELDRAARTSCRRNRARCSTSGTCSRTCRTATAVPRCRWPSSSMRRSGSSRTWSRPPQRGLCGDRAAAADGAHAAARALAALRDRASGVDRQSGASTRGCARRCCAACNEAGFEMRGTRLTRSAPH